MGVRDTYSEAAFTPTIQMSVNFVKEAKQGMNCGSMQLVITAVMIMTRATARLKDGEVVATAVGSYANNKRMAES